MFGAKINCSLNVTFGSLFNVSFQTGDVYVSDNTVNITLLFDNGLNTSYQNFTEPFISMALNLTEMIFQFSSAGGHVNYEILNYNVAILSTWSAKPAAYPLSPAILQPLLNIVLQTQVAKLNE